MSLTCVTDSLHVAAVVAAANMGTFFFIKWQPHSVFYDVLLAANVVVVADFLFETTMPQTWPTDIWSQIPLAGILIYIVWGLAGVVSPELVLVVITALMLLPPVRNAINNFVGGFMQSSMNIQVSGNTGTIVVIIVIVLLLLLAVAVARSRTFASFMKTLWLSFFLIISTRTLYILGPPFINPNPDLCCSNLVDAAGNMISTGTVPNDNDISWSLCPFYWNTMYWIFFVGAFIIRIAILWSTKNTRFQEEQALLKKKKERITEDLRKLEKKEKEVQDLIAKQQGKGEAPASKQAPASSGSAYKHITTPLGPISTTQISRV